MLRAIRMYILEKTGRITPLEAEIDRIKRRYAVKQRQLRKRFYRGIGILSSNAARDGLLMFSAYEMGDLLKAEREEIDRAKQRAS